MRLLRCELENVCQHRSLVHEWHPGLNGIVGPNGAGKSNTLKMIEAALTNNFKVNDGNKEANVALLAPEGAKSRIVLHLEHGDHRVELVRALRGTTEIRVNGGKAITGDSRVNEELTALLGIDARILSEFVFVKQRGIFAFLDDTDAVRAELFQKLFGTERAPAVHALLAKELAGLVVPQASAEIDTLADRVAAHAARLQKLQALGQRYVSAGADWQAAQGQIADYEEARRLRQECRALAEQLRALKPQVLELRARRDQAQADLRAVEAALAEDTPRVAAAWAASNEWSRYRRDQQARQNLEQARQQLETEVARLVPVTVPEELEVLVEEWDRTRDELNRQIGELTRLISTFNGQTAECPTCGTPEADVADRVEAARANLPALIARRNEYQEYEREYEQAVAAEQAWQRAEEKLRSRREQLAATAAAFGEPVSAPALTEDEIRDIFADEAEYKDVLTTQTQPAYAQAARAYDQARGRYIGYREQYRAHREQIPASVPTREEYRLARRVVRREQQQEARRKLIALRTQDVTRTLAADQVLLDRLRAEAEQARRTRAWAEEVRAMQAVVHHSALPRLVSQENLLAVRDDVNELLSRFGARFRVEPTERLGFTVRYDDGREHSATRLSDGQKVVFALAFRVAVNALFTGDIGLFCLDEPTDSLDARNLACLELALGRLRELSHSRGLQCLLVTHERKLARLFDAVLELS